MKSRNFILTDQITRDHLAKATVFEMQSTKIKVENLKQTAKTIEDWTRVLRLRMPGTDVSMITNKLRSLVLKQDLILDEFSRYYISPEKNSKILEEMLN